MDLVELAPIDGFHAYDYMAAALSYKMLNYALSGTGMEDVRAEAVSVSDGVTTPQPSFPRRREPSQASGGKGVEQRHWWWKHRHFQSAWVGPRLREGDADIGDGWAARNASMWNCANSGT